MLGLEDDHAGTQAIEGQRGKEVDVRALRVDDQNVHHAAVAAHEVLEAEALDLDLLDGNFAAEYALVTEGVVAAQRTDLGDPGRHVVAGGRGRDGVERHGWRAPSAECGLDGNMGRGGGRRPPLQLFEDVGRRLDEETCPVVPRRDVVQHRIARRREPVVRADVDEAQAGPRRCTVSRRGVAVAERVQYGGPRRGPQVTAACARDDERGEGWAHFVLVSQGLLARVPSSDFPQIRATTKSYCCTTAWRCFQLARVQSGSVGVRSAVRRFCTN
mmetsp:Transcript_10061/g.26666  ORF Transcript_10061/g.26666 Transcript_10061/m.26666 type:complete len:272 (+) Transcript_10061:388-1203(+)